MGDSETNAVAVRVDGPTRRRAARVVLVRPPVLVPRLALTAPTCPPVAIAYLAAALQAEGHRVQVVDATGEAPDQFLASPDERFVTHGLSEADIVASVAMDADVVGVSAMFSHEWPLTRSLLESLRARCPSALLVVGGEHATAAPELVLADCPAVDAVVLGEGEETLAELVRHRDERRSWTRIAGLALRDDPGDSKVVRTPRRTRLHDIDSLPDPAWDLVPVDAYLDRGLGFGVHRGRSMPLVATRGCPYRCTFCSNPGMWTTRWVSRSPASFVEEMRGHVDRYGAQNFDFYDLTAIVRRSWIVDFCRLLDEAQLDVSWQLPSGTRSEVIDEEVAGLMFGAGCRNMSYAPESGSAAVLERIQKRVDLPKMMASMRGAVRVGINCKANIILGFPGERHREVLATLWFCVRLAALGLHDLSVTPFSPYPGSELFEELRSSGRLRELDDEYFLSLASYSDLTTAVSWSEHISDRALGRYRMLAMGLFYVTSFACRPWRVVKLIRNVTGDGTQESRLEMTLWDHRHRCRHADRVAVGGVAPDQNATA